MSFLTHCWSVPPLSLFYRTLSSWHTLHPTGCCPYVPSPLLLPSSHLFWARDPAPPPWWPSLHCDTPRSSHPLPAACLLIGIGGEERIAVSHGLPLEPTELGQGHSHHSYATAAHSKLGERECAGGKGNRDKAAAEQGSAVKWGLINWKEHKSIATLEFILFSKLAIRRKALEYYHHMKCLFTPFDEIFTHVTVFECQLIGNLFSAFSLINTHQ